jgi:hypothetical protein
MNGLISSNWFNDQQAGGSFNNISEWAFDFGKSMLKKRIDFFKQFESEINCNIKKETNKIDFDEILEIFKTICKDNPQPNNLTPKRKKAILKILETYTLEDIGNVFLKTAQSEWLTGKTIVKGSNSWKVTFDWILEPGNFIKILEDSYKNGNKNNSKTNGEIFTTAMQSEMGNNFKFK